MKVHDVEILFGKRNGVGFPVSVKKDAFGEEYYHKPKKVLQRKIKGGQ